MNYGKKSASKKRNSLISRSSMMGKRAHVSFIRVLFIGLIALCVEGCMRSSEELSGLLSDWSSRGGSSLAFLIGGSYGLAPSLKAQAWAKLSMSPMTFPHHLARVMVLEQIYRAYQINAGSRYHK